MKFSPLLSLASAAALLLGTSSAAITDKGNSHVIPGRYVIEFSDSNVASNSKKLLKALEGKFAKTKLDVVKSFEHSFMRGITLQINTPSDVAADTLAATSNSTLSNIIKAITDDISVTKVYPVHKIPRPQVITSASPADGLDPSQLLPHVMSQVDIVHSNLKNTGKGITVAVLDTGVDYNHPALGGGFGKGYKVAVGYDLVGDDYSAENGKAPVPDDDPLDNCGASTGASGHGTHVSGIIAGKYENFTGVAPDATLGHWRVFGCTGSTSDDIIIEAMLDAYDAGVDVISMSLGDTNAWSETADSVIASRIVASGVPVIIAAGNQGANGAFTVSTPSVGKGVTSVASFDNNYSLSNKFSVDGTPYFYAASPASPEFPANAEIVAGDKNLGSTSDGCAPATIPADVKGKVALVQRGTCTFDIKASNLRDAGAIGVLVYNSGNGDVFTPSTTLPDIAVAGISHADGVAFGASFSAGKTVEAAFDSALGLAPSSTGGTVSSFSSVGPDYEVNFKPDLGAVGGNVYSTLPGYLGSWGIMSGTSMATPYVAGAVALYLKQAETTKTLSTKPTYITEQFQNYAKKAANPSIGGVESPFVQGAGLIQVYDTLVQGIHISPAAISFNDTANIVRTKKLTITNKGDSIVSYQLINNVTVSIVPYNIEQYGYMVQEPVEYGQADASIRFSKKTIKLSPGKSATITVTVTPPATDPAQHIQYGGFIQFKSLQPTAHKDVTVPYIGIVGTQSELPLFLDQTPYVTDFNEIRDYTSKDDVYVFDPKNSTTIPYFIYGLQTPTAHIKATLETKNGVHLGDVMSDSGLDYLQRNTFESPVTYTYWDGTYKPSLGSLVFPVSLKAPKGEYRIKWKALKLLADPNKQSSWETWTSCVIQVV